MARAFAGMMGSSYYAPQQPKIGHWYDALGVVPDTGVQTSLPQGKFYYNAPASLVVKDTSMAAPLATFKRNMQEVDPGYARATYWDDPSRLQSAAMGLYQTYLNNFYQGKVQGEAGRQYLSLPQYMTAVQLDPKVRDVFNGLYGAQVWSDTDTWWTNVNAQAQGADMSAQQWLFAGR